MTPLSATLGVILAGGLARRMGGIDKTLLKLQGKTLLAHVARRLEPQCESLILNANGDASRFAEIKLPVVQDTLPHHPGPLAGLLATMEWAAQNKPSVRWIVSVPGDTPFIPLDLVERLHAVRNASQGSIICAISGSRQHHATGLWPISLHNALRDALAREGIHRVEDWAKLYGLATASWPNEPFDPFFNINTYDDLNAAANMLDHMQLSSRKPDGGCRKQDGRDD
jgi:molybdenum cofactor guanylyltransferase